MSRPWSPLRSLMEIEPQIRVRPEPDADDEYERRRDEDEEDARGAMELRQVHICDDRCIPFSGDPRVEDLPPAIDPNEEYETPWDYTGSGFDFEAETERGIQRR